MHGLEYESDELASGSEDKRRLKKSRESASRERRQQEQAANDHRGKVRFASGADIQLFAVRDFILIGLEQGGTVENVDPPTGPHLSSKFEVDWQTISLTGQADRAPLQSKADKDTSGKDKHTREKGHKRKRNETVPLEEQLEQSEQAIKSLTRHLERKTCSKSLT